MTLFTRLRKLRGTLTRQSLSQHLRDPLYANSYFLFANTAIGSLLGFVYWLLVARLFPANEVGVGTAIVSTASLLAGFGNLGLGLAIIRFLNQMPPERGNKPINGSLTLGGITAVLVSAAYLLGLSVWSPRLLFLRSNPIWICLLLLGVVAWTAAPIIDQSLLAHRAGMAVFWRNLAMHIGKLMMPFALVLTGGAIGVYGSFAIGVALSCVVGLWLLAHRIRKGYAPRFRLGDPTTSKDVLGYSIGNHLGSYLQQVPSFVLPIMVVNSLGEAQTAYYHVAFMIVSMLFSLTIALATSAFVEGSVVDGSTEPLARAARTALVVLVPGMAGLYVVGPLLLRAFGADYVQAAQLVRVMTMAAPFVAMSTLLTSYWRIQKKTKVLNVFAALLSLGIVLVAYSAHTLTGIGYAFLVGTLPAIAFGAATLLLDNRHAIDR